jgi:hypothetical protein
VPVPVHAWCVCATAVAAALCRLLACIFACILALWSPTCCILDCSSSLHQTSRNCVSCSPLLFLCVVNLGQNLLVKRSVPHACL